MTKLLLPRRKFLFAAAAFLASPALVRASNLMPVKAERIVQIKNVLEDSNDQLLWYVFSNPDLTGGWVRDSFLAADWHTKRASRQKRRTFPLPHLTNREGNVMAQAVLPDSQVFVLEGYTMTNTPNV